MLDLCMGEIFSQHFYNIVCVYMGISTYRQKSKSHERRHRSTQTVVRFFTQTVEYICNGETVLLVNYAIGYKEKKGCNTSPPSPNINAGLANGY